MKGEGGPAKLEMSHLCLFVIPPIFYITILIIPVPIKRVHWGESLLLLKKTVPKGVDLEKKGNILNILQKNMSQRGQQKFLMSQFKMSQLGLRGDG